MAEIVEVSEMVTEPEIVNEDVSVVVEEVPVESVIDIEEIAAEVYYYQLEQEVLESSMKSIMPPKVFESFAGYFEETKYLGGLNPHKKVGFHSIDSGPTDLLLR